MAYDFTVQDVLPGTPREVWDAWMSSDGHGAMTGSHAEVDPRAGGAFQAWDGYIAGTTLELEPGTRIVQSWRTSEFDAADPDSRIEVLLEPAEQGTRITLRHTNIPDGQTGYEQGWRDNYFDPMRTFFGRERVETIGPNSIVREHLTATFFSDYQALRGQLLEILTDEDLGYRVGGTNPSLGALCREVGEVQHAYVESFRTFRADFGYRNPDPRLEGSVAALSAWYARLDDELMAAVEALSEDDIAHRRIVRADFEIDGFAPLARVQLDIYREALLIFYGKVSVYLRAMGKALPPQWHHWIG